MLFAAVASALMAFQLEIFPDPASPVPLGQRKLQVTVTVQPPGGKEPHTYKLSLDVPGNWKVETASGSTVRVQVEEGELWAPEREVWVGDEGGRLSLPVRPTVKAQAQLAEGKGVSKIRVKFEESLEKKGTTESSVLSGELWAPVNADGTVGFRLPVGTWDVRISAEGRAPTYLWNVVLPKDAQLGTLSLPAAASVSGFLVDAEGKPWEVATPVTLVPALSHPGEAQLQAKKMELKTLSGKRGFFQFVAVPQGSWMVRVAPKGLSPVEVGPVKVFAGTESQIPEPLRLAPPLPLRVFTDQTTDPWGAPFTLVVTKPASQYVGRYLDIVAKVPHSGLTELSLAPGLYNLSLVSEPDNVWWKEDVELAPPGKELHVSLPFVEVEGKVVRAGEPVVARVCFFAAFKRVCMDADQKGQFRGFLPAAGEWEVEVREGDTEIPAESLRVAAGKRRVVHHVELPNTVVRGKVVMESGEGVAGAQVRAFRIAAKSERERKANAVAVSARDGSFELRGLPPGMWDFAATTAVGASDGILLELGEDREPPLVVLVVRKEKRVRGRVTAQGVPVPGAKVNVTPLCFSQGQSFGLAGLASADATGRFEARVSAGCPQVSVAVFALGYPAFFQRFSLEPERELELALDEDGGELVLALPSSQRQQSVLFYRGAVVPVPLLEVWALRHRRAPSDEGLAIPAMPRGFWMLCPAPAAIMLEGLSSDVQVCPEACSCGHLAAGRTLRLGLSGR